LEIEFDLAEDPLFVFRQWHAGSIFAGLWPILNAPGRKSWENRSRLGPAQDRLSDRDRNHTAVRRADRDRPAGAHRRRHASTRRRPPPTDDTTPTSIHRRHHAGGWGVTDVIAHELDRSARHVRA
jgi:hypothetical protein